MILIIGGIDLKDFLAKDMNDLLKMYYSLDEEQFKRRLKKEQHDKTTIITPVREKYIQDLVSKDYKCKRIPEDKIHQVPDFYVREGKLYIECTSLDVTPNPPPEIEKFNSPSKVKFLMKLNYCLRHIAKKESIYGKGIVGGSIHLPVVFASLTGFMDQPEALNDFFKKSDMFNLDIDYLIVLVDGANYNGFDSHEVFETRIYYKDVELLPILSKIFPSIKIKIKIVRDSGKKEREVI